MQRSISHHYRVDADSLKTDKHTKKTTFDLNLCQSEWPITQTQKLKVELSMYEGGILRVAIHDKHY